MSNHSIIDKKIYQYKRLRLTTRKSRWLYKWNSENTLTSGCFAIGFVFITYLITNKSRKSDGKETTN